MQSTSPFIIKHYIPFDFSRQALDYHPINNKILNIHQPKKDMPLQNMKIKLLQKDNNKQLVLTYKNKTNDLYKPKRQIQFKKLVNIIDQQNLKQKIMIQQMQNSYRQQVLSRQRQMTSSLGIRKQRNSSRQRYNETEQIIKDGILRYRTNDHSRSKTGRQLYKRQQKDQIIFNPQNRYRNHLMRLHSSHNNRQNMRRSISSRKLNRQKNNSEKELNKFTFKIKGRKAPQAEMIDHLRKSTIDSLNNNNQY